MLDEDLSQTEISPPVKAEPVDGLPVLTQVENVDEGDLIGSAAAFSSSKPRTNAPFIKKSRPVSKRSDLVEHSLANSTRDQEKGNSDDRVHSQHTLQEYPMRRASRRSSRRSHAARNSQANALHGDGPFPFPDRVRPTAEATKTSAVARGSDGSSRLAHDALPIANAIRKTAHSSAKKDSVADRDTSPVDPKRTRSLLDTLSDAADEEGRRNKIAKKGDDANSDVKSNDGNESRAKRLPNGVLNGIQPPSPPETSTKLVKHKPNGEPTTPDLSISLSRAPTVVIIQEKDGNNSEGDGNTTTSMKGVESLGDSVSSSSSLSPPPGSLMSVSSNDEDHLYRMNKIGGRFNENDAETSANIDTVRRSHTAPVGSEQGYHTQHSRVLRDAASADKNQASRNLTRSRSLSSLVYIAACIRDIGNREKTLQSEDE